jgi:hypothetical protein
LTGSIVAPVLLIICLALSGSPVLAQQITAPPRNRIPYARVGLYFGRTGIAQGPGAYLEINLFRWLGVCAIASHSQTVHVVDGDHARVSDFSAGGCVSAHLPEMKGFLISPFVQITHQNEHDRIVIPLDDGASFLDRDDPIHRVRTVGTAIDRAITKNGPRWIARIGKNFGDGPAAYYAGGLYFVGGLVFPLDHTVELGRSLRKMVGLYRPFTVNVLSEPPVLGAGIRSSPPGIN